VDSSGQIIAVYAVPINEGRGIYAVRSLDNGDSWIAPVKVFDAAIAGWHRIGQSRVTLGTDGTLHLVFVRQSTRVGQPEGLYYSRSVDGGATWSEPLIISSSQIQWADVVSLNSSIHIVWQQYDGLVFANLAQVSSDGGLTWGQPQIVTGVNDESTQVALASDGRGLLHFIQLLERDDGALLNQEHLTLQDWKWDGSTWTNELTKDISIAGRNVAHGLYADVTSTGFLGVFIPVEYTDAQGADHREILTFNRYITGTESASALQAPVVPLPTEIVPESTDALQLAPTSVSASPINSGTASSLQRNIIGLVLIGVGIIAAIALVIWRRPGNRTK
jgi:hypothetical protein